jgi:hypothetical protein
VSKEKRSEGMKNAAEERSDEAAIFMPERGGMIKFKKDNVAGSGMA